VHRKEAQMKKIKSLLFVLLAVSMIAVGVIGASAHTFKDVTKYDDAISLLSEIEVIKGYSTTIFGPEDPVNRWQMALLISKMLTGDCDSTRWEKQMSGIVFTDIKSQHYMSSIAYAHSNGIVVGKTTTEFYPEAGITLQEALTMAIRALGYPAKTYDVDWPKKYLALADTLGLTDGLKGVENTDPLTRGETAQILYNTINCEMYGKSYTMYENAFGKDATLVLAATPEMKLSGSIKTPSNGYLVFCELKSNGILGDSYQIRESKIFDSAVDPNEYLGHAFSIRADEDFTNISSISVIDGKDYTSGLSINEDNDTITFGGATYETVYSYSYKLAEGTIPKNKEIIVYGLNTVFTGGGIIYADEMANTTANYTIKAFDDNKDGYADRAIYTPYSFGQYSVSTTNAVKIANNEAVNSFTVTGKTNVKNGDYVLYSYNTASKTLDIKKIYTATTGTVTSYSPGGKTIVIDNKTYTIGNANLPGANYETASAGFGNGYNLVGQQVKIILDGTNILTVATEAAAGAAGFSVAPTITAYGGYDFMSYTTTTSGTVYWYYSSIQSAPTSQNFMAYYNMATNKGSFSSAAGYGASNQLAASTSGNFVTVMFIDANGTYNTPYLINKAGASAGASASGFSTSPTFSTTSGYEYITYTSAYSGSIYWYYTTTATAPTTTTFATYYQQAAVKSMANVTAGTPNTTNTGNTANTASYGYIVVMIIDQNQKYYTPYVVSKTTSSAATGIYTKQLAVIKTISNQVTGGMYGNYLSATVYSDAYGTTEVPLAIGTVNGISAYSAIGTLKVGDIIEYSASSTNGLVAVTKFTTPSYNNTTVQGTLRYSTATNLSLTVNGVTQNSTIPYNSYATKIIYFDGLNFTAETVSGTSYIRQIPAGFSVYMTYGATNSGYVKLIYIAPNNGAGANAGIGNGVLSKDLAVVQSVTLTTAPYGYITASVITSNGNNVPWSIQVASVNGTPVITTGLNTPLAVGDIVELSYNAGTNQYFVTSVSSTPSYTAVGAAATLSAINNQMTVRNSYSTTAALTFTVGTGTKILYFDGMTVVAENITSTYTKNIPVGYSVYVTNGSLNTGVAHMVYVRPSGTVTPSLNPVVNALYGNIAVIQSISNAPTANGSIYSYPAFVYKPSSNSIESINITNINNTAVSAGSGAPALAMGDIIEFSDLGTSLYATGTAVAKKNSQPTLSIAAAAKYSFTNGVFSVKYDSASANSLSVGITSSTSVITYNGTTVNYVLPIAGMSQALASGAKIYVVYPNTGSTNASLIYIDTRTN